MASEQQQAALGRLIDLCDEVGTCRRQFLDQLGEQTAEQIGRLLNRCQVDASTLLAAAATADVGAGRWPAEVLGALVAAARAQGESWDDIGRHFGVSRQAAHQRFAGYEARLRPIVTDLLSVSKHPQVSTEQAISGLLDAIADSAG
jgi:hypothetical protein